MDFLDNNTHCIKIKSNDQKYNINMIIIIDNIHLFNIRNLNDFIIELYKYISFTGIQNIKLIITQPYKLIDVTKNNFFTVFRNIVNVKNKLNASDEYYHTPIKQCYDHCIQSVTNEIIMFTQFKNVVPAKFLISIKKLMEKPDIAFTLISNNNYINQANIKTLLFNSKVYDEAIRTGSVFQAPMNNHLVLFELNYGNLYKTNTNHIMYNDKIYKCLLIDQIDNISQIQNQSDISITNNLLDILDAVLFNTDRIQSSEKIDKDLYIALSDIILKFIEQNEYMEAKHFAILIYDRLKKNCDKVINGLVHNDNNKLFIEFGKKAEIKGKHNQVIKNIDKVLQKDDIVTQNIQTFIDENRDNDDDKFIESCEFFNSTITLSNWFEEMENNNGIGLLIKVGKNETCITNTYMSINDFIAMAIDYFHKNKNIKFGELINTSIIHGMAVGDANAVIPIYINKNHWLLNKKHLDMILAIICTGNPFSYQPAQIKIYFELFSDMTIKMFNKESLNEKSVRNYIAFMRTCAEICFEKGYNRGISKIISNYLNNNSEHIDYIKICSQALVTGHFLNKDSITQLIHFILIDLIKSSVTQSKDNKYIELLKLLNIMEIEDEAKILVDKLNDILITPLKFLWSYYKMNLIVHEIIKTNGSYNKFIKNLDHCYGLLDHTNCQKLIQLIQVSINNDIKNITIKDIYQLLSIEYSDTTILFHAVQSINKDLMRTTIIRSGDDILKYVNDIKN